MTILSIQHKTKASRYESRKSTERSWKWELESSGWTGRGNTRKKRWRKRYKEKGNIHVGLRLNKTLVAGWVAEVFPPSISSTLFQHFPVPKSRAERAKTTQEN